MNCQKEYTSLIWAVTTSHNCGLPMKHIIPNWTYRTLRWRVTGQITKFLINPFQRHSLCFSSGSSLSRCVLEGPAKTLDFPGGWEGLSLRLTPALPDTGAFCKNGANQHSHRPRRDPDESKSLKNGRDPRWVGWQSPLPASMPCSGPKRGPG